MKWPWILNSFSQIAEKSMDIAWNISTLLQEHGCLMHRSMGTPLPYLLVTLRALEAWAYINRSHQLGSSAALGKSWEPAITHCNQIGIMGRVKPSYGQSKYILLPICLTGYEQPTYCSAQLHGPAQFHVSALRNGHLGTLRVPGRGRVDEGKNVRKDWESHFHFVSHSSCLRCNSSSPPSLLPSA